MSQAEELLNSMTTKAVPTPLPSENYIVIDSNRFVHVPESLKRLGVQYDHNIETVTFRAPRYWDGRDLSFMKIYINYMRADGVRGQQLATNLQVDSELNVMTFDWAITNHVTHAKGNISFLICGVSTDADGYEVRHWNSELNQECYISEGLECEEYIVDAYPAIITQLLLQMDQVKNEASSVDVTASVGQTIVVEEVDGNGKPTKWKAAEYQPRTHYIAETEFLPETTIAFVEGTSVLGSIYFTVGDTYKVTWDGVEYECVAVDTSNALEIESVGLGNLGDYGFDETGEPFQILCAAIVGGAVVNDATGRATSATVKIVGNAPVKIPEMYFPDSLRPFYVTIIETENPGGMTYDTAVTQAEMKAYIEANRYIVAKLLRENGDIFMLQMSYATADAETVEFYAFSTVGISSTVLSIIELTATDGRYTVALPRI